MEKLKTKNYNTITEKTSALSLGKIDKYDYLPGKEIFPFDQSRIKSS